MGSGIKSKLWRPASEYYAWQDMKARCLNKDHSAYLHYGGRGITVSDEWVNSFKTFISDMGERPDKNHSLERINNDLGYCKENCKWSTKAEQNRNKRNNVIIEYNGKSQCLMDWSKELGINIRTLTSRIKTYGYSIEDAFTKPLKRQLIKQSK